MLPGFSSMTSFCTDSFLAPSGVFSSSRWIAESDDEFEARAMQRSGKGVAETGTLERRVGRRFDADLLTPTARPQSTRSVRIPVQNRDRIMPIFPVAYSYLFLYRSFERDGAETAWTN